MALIPTERQTPLGHMDAMEVLRRRLPPEPAPAIEWGQAAKTITRIDVGQRIPLAAFRAPAPQLIEITAVSLPAPGITAEVYFEIQWASRGAEGPLIRFQVSEPITLPADTLTVNAVSGAGVLLTGCLIHGSILAPAPGPKPARPLWSNPVNRAVAIGFGASATFILGPFTRRIRVGRANIATPFTVNDVYGGVVQAIAANGEFSWREVSVGQAISVTNNAAAGSDNFTVFEELGL